MLTARARHRSLHAAWAVPAAPTSAPFRYEADGRAGSRPAPASCLGAACALPLALLSLLRWLVALLVLGGRLVLAACRVIVSSFEAHELGDVLDDWRREYARALEATFPPPHDPPATAHLYGVDSAPRPPPPGSHQQVAAASTISKAARGRMQRSSRGPAAAIGEGVEAAPARRLGASARGGMGGGGARGSSRNSARLMMA